MKLHIATIAAVCLMAASPVIAADAVTATPAVTAPSHWSIGIEGSPEFYAIDEDPHDPISKKPSGHVADYYGKASLGYTFDSNWVVGGSYQFTQKKNRDAAGNLGSNTYQSYLEGTVGYKFKFDAFTLTPSAGVGYTWGKTGIFGDTAADKDLKSAYYALYLAGDWKLNKQWTWNVFNARWRDSFNHTWQTPKLSTGVTYSVNPHNAVYLNVGYAWKEVSSVGQAATAPFNPNYGSLDGDKWNIGVGYKYAF